MTTKTADQKTADQKTERKAADDTSPDGASAGTPARPKNAARRARSSARALLKRLPTWTIVPAAAVAGVAAGGVYGAVSTPEYSATSYVLVVPTGKSDPASALGFATAYGRVASQVAVLGDAQVWAGVPVEKLKAQVTTATSPDAPMISVTATDANPATAVDMADGVARALVSNGTHLQTDTNVKVLQFSRAIKPVSPTSPSTPLAALVGGCAGGLLGALALLVRPRRRRESEPYPSATVPGPATAHADGLGAQQETVS
ncbi:lipopolysaccharide biosynthesis protein [Streptomyces sp. NRRL F-5126]|uniref:lipopolysaccharide biosynthesis protein n=1 Tax=Streptomyces sp. NRRL F-5126 TaxID=1463857 RepID=UPI000A420952|nr:lipopolysaccharide biosynthesis protein [Streptomyces sp. NRRL F-5126]